MKLIIGLGNPGKEFNKTRHNIGFIIIDNFLGEVKWQRKFNSLFFDTEVNGIKTIFIKPETYMNLSGDAIAKFIKYYKINNKNILIIHDDLDLPFGKIKIKTDSGSGGHNGINSIISSLKTQQFNRLKIGIANNKKIETKDYVLGKFTKMEEKQFPIIFAKTKTLIDLFCEHDINVTMNKLSVEEDYGVS